MRKHLTILTIAFSLIQCQRSEQNQKNNTRTTTEISDTTSINTQEPIDNLTSEIIIDSLEIAKKGAYKIILSQNRVIDRVYAKFAFYKKTDSTWKINQSFIIEKDDITSLEPQFQDFNNDGFNDLTFNNGIAARGANELRSLFLFDNEKEKLIHISNSNNYPNIRYNKELDCIDAWLIYGGSTTLFLKIESDTLKEFAGVSLFDTRDVFTIDKNGKRNILSQEIIRDSIVYRRYSNYNPLKEY